MVKDKFQCLTVKEIAIVEGITNQCVNYHLKRATKKLRKALEEKGYTFNDLISYIKESQDVKKD